MRIEEKKYFSLWHFVPMMVLRHPADAGVVTGIQSHACDNTGIGRQHFNFVPNAANKRYSLTFAA